jgi:hypothetical protein
MYMYLCFSHNFGDLQHMLLGNYLKKKLDHRIIKGATSDLHSKDLLFMYMSFESTISKNYGVDLLCFCAIKIRAPLLILIPQST